MADENKTQTGAENQETSTDDGKGREGTVTVAQLEARLARQKESFEKRLKEERKVAIDEFREDQGLNDEVLARLKETRDQEQIILTAGQWRKYQGDLTKANKRADEAEGQVGVIARERMQEKIGSVLSKAAMDNKAIDPLQVSTLLKGRVAIDDPSGEPYVTDGNGQTVSEMVKEYCDKNRHLLRSESQGGSGSTPPTGKRPGDAPKDTPEYRQTLLAKTLGGG